MKKMPECLKLYTFLNNFISKDYNNGDHFNSRHENPTKYHGDLQAVQFVLDMNLSLVALVLTSLRL